MKKLIIAEFKETNHLDGGYTQLWWKEVYRRQGRFFASLNETISSKFLTGKSQI
jgi:hypothetical protein